MEKISVAWETKKKSWLPTIGHGSGELLYEIYVKIWFR